MILINPNSRNSLTTWLSTFTQIDHIVKEIFHLFYYNSGKIFFHIRQTIPKLDDCDLILHEVQKILTFALKSVNLQFLAKIYKYQSHLKFISSLANIHWMLNYWLTLYSYNIFNFDHVIFGNQWILTMDPMQIQWNYNFWLCSLWQWPYSINSCTKSHVIITWSELAKYQKKHSQVWKIQTTNLNLNLYQS